MNVGLLECDHVPARYRHIAGGYREMFTALFVRRAPHLRFTYYDACHGGLPAAPDACDAYLCTGSRQSVYETDEWIKAVKDFVQRLHEAEKPFVGICFGQQILAEALGGTVAPSPRGWGVGVHAMRILRQEPWMRPTLDLCRLQYMHGDQVQRLPPRAVLLAGTAHCDVAMFRLGASMLGITGHPEFPPAYNEALMRSRADRIGAECVEAGLASLVHRTDHEVVAQWIANFLEQQTPP